MSESHLRMITYSVYSTLICCLIIFIYAIAYKKGKNVKPNDLIIASIIIIISSLRYGVGSDYFTYLRRAAYWSSLFSSNIKALFSYDVLINYRLEIGYKLISIISGKLSSSPYFVFWLVSVIIYLPIVIFCRKYTANSFIALSVFLLFGYWGISLNVIGQSIAMVFLLYANIALEQKKYVAATLLIICAISFHTTAVISALVFLMIHFGILKNLLKPTKRNVFVMITIGVILRGSVGLFNSILSKSLLFSRYTQYLSTDLSEKFRRTLMMIGVSIETVLILVILFLAIKHIERLRIDNPRINKTISTIMIGIPFSIIGISRSEWLWLSNRFAEYFFINILILIPAIIDLEKFPDKRAGIIVIHKRQFLFWVVMIVWHLLFAFLMFNNNDFRIDTYLLH